MTTSIVLCCLALQAHADPITADSIIAKYVEVKGGRESLEKIRNVVMKGAEYANGEKIGTYECYQAPNRNLMILRFLEGTEERHGTDGKIAWRIDKHGKPTVLSGLEAQEYIRQYSTVHEALAWKRQFKNIEYAGKATIGTSEAYRLVFHAANGQKVTRFFDTTNGLFVREERDIAGEVPTHLVSEILDYRKYNGILVSRRRINYYGSDVTLECRHESLETNSIDDMSIFAIPDSVTRIMKGRKLR